MDAVVYCCYKCVTLRHGKRKKRLGQTDKFHLNIKPRGAIRMGGLGLSLAEKVIECVVPRANLMSRLCKNLTLLNPTLSPSPYTPYTPQHGTKMHPKLSNTSPLTPHLRRPPPPPNTTNPLFFFFPPPLRPPAPFLCSNSWNATSQSYSSSYLSCVLLVPCGGL